MPQNATALLKADHEKVDQLFQQYEEADGQVQKQKTIIEQVCKELEVHAAIEEEIFYPAMRKIGKEGQELISEAVEEHQSIKDAVNHLKGANPNDADYESTVEELMECVSHHVEEEEGEMFPEAEQQLGRELTRLGEQMQQRKQQLTGSPRMQEQQAHA